MRKRFSVLLILAVCLTLAASCADGRKGYDSPNHLMDGASPETSALSLTIYDGTQADKYFLFDVSEIKLIISELDSVPVKEVVDWKIDDLDYPIYGLEISDTEGGTIAACWSNGHWITDEGRAYIFDYDFAALADREDWQFSYGFSSLSAVPCAYWLCCDDNGWNDRFLIPSDQTQEECGAQMTLISREDEWVTVNISNNGAEEFLYGEDFVLETCIEGVWYSVPTTPGNWGFNSIAYVLSPGGTNEHRYWLGAYGQLPAGKYRIAAYGMTVEFEIV